MMRGNWKKKDEFKMADKSTNVRPGKVSKFSTTSPSNLLRTLPSGKAHGFYFTEPDQKEPP
jgi:hypothetical protein